jgi:DNA repair protein SbcC/Rad50
VKLEDRRKEIEAAPRAAKEHAANLKRGRAELEKIDGALQIARSEWDRDKQEADTKIEQLEAGGVELEKQRELLLKEGENGTCPICERPLGDHYRTVLESIEEQIVSTTHNREYFRSRQKQLVTAPAELLALEERRKIVADAIAKVEKQLIRAQTDTQELATVDVNLIDRDAKLVALRQEISRIPEGYSVERHAAVRKQCDDLRVLESRATKLTGTLEREAQLRAEHERVTTALAVIGRRLADLAAERAQLPDVEKRFDAVRIRHESAVAQQRVSEIETATANAQHTSAAAAATAASRAVTDLERAMARLAELNDERRLHEELDRQFGEERTQLTVQVRPEISERTSILLAELTDGRYSELQLDESYDFVLVEDGLPKHVISGGEDDLANLVLRLAISQMIAERAGQPMSLLILDEVFGSLDESRRENVAGLLHDLHDRFEQIILITHVDLPAGHLDHEIRLTYDAESGSSKVFEDGRTAVAEPEPEEREMGAAD